MPKQVLDISTGSIIRVFAVLLLIGFLFSIWQILASIFMAVVIASVAEPGISFLTRLRLHRFIAAMLVYLAGIGIVASAFFLVIPTLVVESRQISTDLPVAYEQLVNDIEIFFGNEPSQINAGEHFRSLFGNFQQGIGGIGSNIFSITFGLFGGVDFCYLGVCNFVLSCDAKRRSRAFFKVVYSRYEPPRVYSRSLEASAKKARQVVSGADTTRSVYRRTFILGVLAYGHKLRAVYCLHGRYF